MYAEIIPQIRTIPKLGVFDYKITPGLNIKKGDIVKINFRNTEKVGLVYSIKKSSRYKKIKPVISKVDDISLSLTQLDLITWMAKKYEVSLALAFKTVFPEIPKRKRDVLAKTRHVSSLHDIKIKKDRINNIQAAVKQTGQQKKPYILHYNDINEKNAFLLGLIKQYKKKQVLIIVPEKKNVFELAAVFKNYSPTLIYSGLPKNQQWQTWQNIQNNETKLIIGTKTAIFVPPDNLELIVIDDEEDKSHANYDQNPKYHVLDIAKQLINNRTKLVLTSQSPSVSSYYGNESIKLLNKMNNKVHLIDLEKEKQAGNYSYFSNRLIDLIETHNRSLLLFNRKGEAKWLICRNCQEILPYSSTSHCPNCKANNFKKGSFGTSKLLNDLKQIFPNKKIMELTKDNPDKSFDPEKPGPDIIIGTEYALRVLDLDSIDLMALISVDHQLTIPNWQASERVFQLITRIINLNKETAIQTNSADNILINNAVHRDYDSFFKREIASRKQFGYPPFDKNDNI